MPDSSDSPLRLKARQGALSAWALLFVVAALLPAVSLRVPAANAATCPAFSALPVRASAGGATAVAVGEFTGDAHIDAVVGNIGVNQISRFTNDGSGDLFARGDYPAGRPLDSLQQNAIAVADFDEDGKEDLVVVKLLDATLTVMVGESFGAFRPHASFPTGGYPFDVETGDFDADGHEDAVVANFMTSNITAFYGDGTGSFPHSVTKTVGAFPTSLAGADLDVDGVPEIVVATDAGVQIVYQFGPRSLAVETVVVGGSPANLNAVVTASLNTDLFPDAVVGDAAGNVRVLMGTGAAISEPRDVFTVGPTVATGASAGLTVGVDGLIAGDLDGDNDVDVVAVVSNGGLLLPGGEPALRILTGDGSGALTAATSVVLGRYATKVAAADMNGDGALDLVVADDAGVYVVLSTCKPTAPLDLAPASLEVVQVVQDEALSVPLIAGKRAVVRARVTTSRSVTNIDALLWRVDASGNTLGAPVRPSNPTGRITVTPSASRQRLNDLFFFDLPDAWASAGTLRLRVDVNPSGVPFEADRSNNSRTATVSFLPAKTLKVTLVDWRWKLCRASDAQGIECKDGASSIGYSPKVTDAAFNAIEAELRRRLPISAVRVNRIEVLDDATFLSENGAPIPGTVELTHVAALRQSLQSKDPGTIFLWVNKNVSGGVAWKYDPNYPERRWDAITSTIADTAVHEVGHLLGRLHTLCSGTESDSVEQYPGGRIGGPATNPEQFVGFSVADGSGQRTEFAAVVPSRTGDVMSYCSPRWPSDQTYIAWRQMIESWNELIDPVGDFLLVSGTVTAGGTAGALIHAERLPQVASLTSLQPGAFTLRLSNASGTVLAERAFTPSQALSHEHPGEKGFVETLPWTPGTRRIAMVNSAGAVLDERVVSANAPAVPSVSHTGGNTLPGGGAVTVRWQGADVDGDSLTASVQYSADGGATWTLLGTGIRGTAFSVDAGRLAGTNGRQDGRFRVLLSDGVQTGIADTPSFAVPNNAPRVRVASPLPGSRYELGQVVALEAVTEDVEDGVLEGAAVTWSSSTDGLLGRGRLRNVLLTEGVHVLTVNATDDEGASTTASVTVTVAQGLDLGRPPVADAGDDVTALEGQRITLDGTASFDPEGDPLLVSWRLVDGPAVDVLIEDGGTKTPTITVPDGGMYTLELRASDGLNEPSADEVTVRVGNVPPNVRMSTPTAGQLFPTGDVTLQADFTDPGVLDEHACTVNWDVDRSGFVASGALDADTGRCTATRSLSAGVYSIRVSVEDQDGGVGTATVRIVVYDPSAGFVKGGGWIKSPPGAYSPDPTRQGRAKFRFVSKYKRGSTEPTGETELSFSAGGFTFRSTSYQWLVVSSARAQYKGVGQVNGSREYSFLLTAEDRHRKGGSGVDRFRIKVWDRATGTVIYDNVGGAPDDLDSASPQAIGSGSIVIHN